MITNLYALLVITNFVMRPCEFCRPDGTMLAVLHEHQYDQVVYTNYLPIIQVTREIKKEK